MYEFRPQRGNHTAGKVVFCLFLATAVCLIGSALVPRYPVILQALGLIFLVPIIQITVRYMLSRYLYRLRVNENGEADFEIFLYRGGKQMQLVCRIGLNEITAARELSEENRKPPHKIKRYHYHPDMAPAKGLVLSVTNGDGDCEILISPDDYLTAVFTGAPLAPPAAGRTD